MSANPLQWSIGLVGYGEVGRILAEDLRARGVGNILAYDIKLGTAQDAPLRAHASPPTSRSTPTQCVTGSTRISRIRCWPPTWINEPRVPPQQ